VLARYGQGQGARVLDLGTGSGAVVLAIASEAGRHRYWACDISTAAVALARRNADEAGLREKVHFFMADWFSALKPGWAVFEMIVSNPPYVASGVLAGLQPEIVRFEPKLALDGGPDGLRSHAVIIEAAHRYLAPEGVLILEIGHDQREAIRQIAAASGHYDRFNCAKDYSGHDRVAMMFKK
jgi:release factor glutamine methyltransferase